MPRPPRTTGFFSFAATFVAFETALLGLPLGLGAAASWLSASDSSESSASLVLASFLRAFAASPPATPQLNLSQFGQPNPTGARVLREDSPHPQRLERAHGPALPRVAPPAGAADQKIAHV